MWSPAPAREIRDCISWRTTKVNGSNANVRVKRPENSRLIIVGENSGGNEVSRLAELFNCWIWKFVPGLYVRHTGTIAFSIHIRIPRKL